MKLDLAVVAQPERAVREGHRLIGRVAEVDDLEPRMTESEIAIHERAGSVRSAMPDHGEHAIDLRPLDGYAAAPPDSGNSAHRSS